MPEVQAGNRRQSASIPGTELEAPVPQLQHSAVDRAGKDNAGRSENHLWFRASRWTRTCSSARPNLLRYRLRLFGMTLARIFTPTPGARFPLRVPRESPSPERL